MRPNPLPAPPPSVFADLLERDAKLVEDRKVLIREAALRIRKARKDYTVARLESVLNLSRNTYFCAENPWGDTTMKAFSLERLAAIYAATVKAVKMLDELSMG